MEEATLQAVKRAMPGHGRARIHQKLLSLLAIEEQAEVEVSTKAGATLTLTVFADELVEDGTIRISGEDLKKLKIPDGGEVFVRRKIPLEEQIMTAADKTAEQIKGGAQELSTKITESAGKLQKDAAETAEKVGAKAKELTKKVKTDTKPVGDKIAKAAKSSAEAIKEKLPIGKFSPEVEKGLAILASEDAKKVRSLLTGAEGTCSAAVVSFASGRTVGNLTLPPEAKIVAIQRDKQVLTFGPDTILQKGDVAYITGSEDAIGFVTRMLEG
ncbi:MAG: hypothetical protein GXY48_14010 [Methanomicrobiales archaeon]|nr:hypothetical protein [Methanomicrobiales archaeon]